MASDVETASHASIRMLNWNWTIYKVYGEQDKSFENSWGYIMHKAKDECITLTKTYIATNHREMFLQSKLHYRSPQLKPAYSKFELIISFHISLLPLCERWVKCAINNCRYMQHFFDLSCNTIAQQCFNER